MDASAGLATIFAALNTAASASTNLFDAVSGVCLSEISIEDFEGRAVVLRKRDGEEEISDVSVLRALSRVYKTLSSDHTGVVGELLRYGRKWAALYLVAYVLARSALKTTNKGSNNPYLIRSWRKDCLVVTWRGLDLYLKRPHDG